MVYDKLHQDPNLISDQQRLHQRAPFQRATTEAAIVKSKTECPRAASSPHLYRPSFVYKWRLYTDRNVALGLWLFYTLGF